MSRLINYAIIVMIALGAATYLAKMNVGIAHDRVAVERQIIQEEKEFEAMQRQAYRDAQRRMDDLKRQFPQVYR